MLQNAYYHTGKTMQQFCDTLRCLRSPRAYYRQSRKYETYALYADASTDFITAALLLSLQTLHRPYS